MRRAAEVAVLCIVFAASASAQYEKLMEKGEGADLRGKTKKAAARFEAAAQVARTPEERVKALLAFTDAIRGAQPNAALDPVTAQEVEEAFKKAIAEAQGVDSFKGHNDYAVFLLDRGNPAGAAGVFAEGVKDVGSVPPATASRYFYNFALAHLRNGEKEKAYDLYRRAIEHDPGFSVASAAAYSVLATAFGSDRAPAEAAELIRALIAGKQIAQAGLLLEAALQKEEWHAETEGMEKILGVFVRWLVESETTPAVVAEKWLPRLAELSQHFEGAARDKLRQLMLVYRTDDLPLSFDADYEVYFSGWHAPDERRYISRLLQQSAGAFAAAGKEKSALQRYFAAWRVDPENVDALTYFAEILYGRHDDDSMALLDRFVDAVFARGQGQFVEAASDLNAVMRLHVIMGMIFAERSQWGPAEEPHSALFHYAAAMRTYETLRKRDPQTPVYPGVYSNLAAAYQETKNIPEAWRHYVAAAEASIETGEVEAARLLFEIASDLGYSPSGADAERVRILAENIRSRKEPAGRRTDLQIAEEVRERLSAHPEINFGDFQVDVSQGVVTLRYERDKPQQVEQARVTIQKMTGVRDVRVERILARHP